VSTILVVQEDASLSDGWSLALEDSGYIVVSESSAAAGLDRVRRGGVDAIVVDASRKPLKKFIKQLEKLREPPPFLLISSRPTAPAESARLGAAKFLPKPCSRDEISQAIHRLVAIPRAIDNEQTQPYEHKNRR
jgi:DNA-binding NtrC family response regulator